MARYVRVDQPILNSCKADMKKIVILILFLSPVISFSQNELAKRLDQLKSILNENKTSNRYLDISFIPESKHIVIDNFKIPLNDAYVNFIPLKRKINGVESEGIVDFECLYECISFEGQQHLSVAFNFKTKSSALLFIESIEKFTIEMNK